MSKAPFNSVKAVAFAIAVALAMVAVALPGSAWAADNTATGDIGGDATDLTDSNTFTLNTTTLALVKAAFLADGTQLTSGQSVPRGTIVRFLLYVDNSTDVPVADLNVSDVLAAAFAFQAGDVGIRVDNSLASSASPTELDIYNAVRVTAALTDAVDGDVASYVGGTVTVGTGGGNGQADVNGDSIYAVLIDVEMQ